MAIRVKRLALFALLAGGLGLWLAIRSSAPTVPPSPPRAARADQKSESVHALVPMLLDTDIGTDIDDAFALALAMRSSEIEILGVTTVSGDTAARARLAARILWDSGFPFVPVAAGAPGKPLPKAQTRWGDGFSSPQLQTTQSQSAVDLLRSQIRQREGKITLVAIGPLTNVAALIEQDPETARKLKRIVLMGGAIAHGYGRNLTPVPEYNIASDPAAAQKVFASGIPILVVPLDVTAMLDLSAENRHRIFTHLTTLTNTLTILYHLWNQETPILFDAMAVAVLIDPSLCETRELRIQVDDKGFTRAVPGGPPNATVALRTDPEKFWRLYLTRVAP